ncbi:MAG: hypothetical protein A3A58_02320 [Candidatus Blackburnbacteria bacterium RIFCSPLOWO2_01_FULL_41_27]|uniref:Resolvase HTH domain-containing protein n=2 Tax=Candidatus Blackburniibacteriota TaxID=1817898 RepID=A0A1G1V7K8_9BACT|nr:MAG: hypothetical protein A3F61_03195 [Candidatus Blackburnbacteria bacterium RIFCSPHIGHO2_12_FULL_41_13b]OGY12571.1 MAG: hypothetical protein A3A58_02320 [Candidatus Blackburnbacteria bacterium RIFCSPLOWO2_01_FULL_41_27]
MPRLIPKETRQKIITLRQKGWSLPEIKKETSVGQTTVFRYIQGVEILPEYLQFWKGKQGGSIKRMEIAKKNAALQAKRLVSRISKKEKSIFLSALYWGEGNKKDFIFTNSDPEMIQVFTRGLIKLFGVSKDDFKVSIRIFEDLDRNKSLKFWSRITGVPIKKFVSVNVLSGKKSGKLEYGMCRVRIKKGGNMLKYISAIRREVVAHF